MNKILHIKNKQRCSKTYTKQSGFSLIEIMVAALVLSIGILGVASLQIIGMKGTHQSYMKQQAANIIHDLTERMHSNKQAVVNGSYLVDSDSFNCSTAPFPSCAGSSALCSPLKIADYDKKTLICGFKKGSAPSTGGIKATAAGDLMSLVGGSLQVTCAGGLVCPNGDIQIVMQWTEQELDSREAVGGPKDSITLNTRIRP